MNKLARILKSEVFPLVVLFDEDDIYKLGRIYYEGGFLNLEAKSLHIPNSVIKVAILEEDGIYLSVGITYPKKLVDRNSLYSVMDEKVLPVFDTGISKYSKNFVRDNAKITTVGNVYLFTVDYEIENG